MPTYNPSMVMNMMDYLMEPDDEKENDKKSNEDWDNILDTLLEIL